MAARYLALTLLAAALGAAQTDRGQASRPLRPCRPANADYARLANETGGQVFQMRGPDLDKAAVVMDSKLSHPETILAATGVLQRGESRQFTVPVDSTVRSVSFSVTVECEPVVVVVRPSGETVLPASAPGISSTTLSAGRIVTARAPEPGSWLLLVSGRGRYSVQALAGGRSVGPADRNKGLSCSHLRAGNLRRGRLQPYQNEGWHRVSRVRPRLFNNMRRLLERRGQNQRECGTLRIGAQRAADRESAKKVGKLLAVLAASRCPPLDRKGQACIIIDRLGRGRTRLYATGFCTRAKANPATLGHVPYCHRHPVQSCCSPSAPSGPCAPLQNLRPRDSP